MPLLLGVLLAVVLLVAIIFGGVLAAIGLGGGGAAACAPTAPTGKARSPVSDIPADYLGLYRRAGAEHGIGWPVLAAIGKVESDHGRGRAPGIRSGANSAGAMGPMQFLPGTWRAYGVDGDHDGRKDVYDPADSIPAAARYLKANGAPQHLRTAIWHYNHADWYVEKVLAQAEKYAAAGEAAELDSKAEMCAAPGVVPPNAVAGKVVAYARAQLGKPYVWGAEGPDAFDCSGLTLAAYRAAGIAIPRVSGEQWRQLPHVPRGQEQPGDLVFFNTGPGTSADNPGHVGIVIGDGKMIAAPNSTTVVQIQPYASPALIGFARPRGR